MCVHMRCGQLVKRIYNSVNVCPMNLGTLDVHAKERYEHSQRLVECKPSFFSSITFACIKKIMIKRTRSPRANRNSNYRRTKGRAT